MAVKDFKKMLAESQEAAQIERDTPIGEKSKKKAPQASKKVEESSKKSARTLFALTPERMKQLKRYVLDHDMTITGVVENCLEKCGVFKDGKR